MRSCFASQGTLPQLLMTSLLGYTNARTCLLSGPARPLGASTPTAMVLIRQTSVDRFTRKMIRTLFYESTVILHGTLWPTPLITGSINRAILARQSCQVAKGLTKTLTPTYRAGTHICDPLDISDNAGAPFF